MKHLLSTVAVLLWGLSALAQDCLFQPDSLSAPEGTYSYWFQKALYHEINQDIPEAIEAFRLCTELDSTQASAYYYLSKCLTHYLRVVGDKGLPEIIRLVETAVRLDPDNSRYALTLFNLYKNQEQYDQLIPLAQEQVRRHPDDYNWYLYLGESYTRNGQLKQAIASLDAYERLNGSSLAVRNVKFELYVTACQTGKGLKELEDYGKSHPYDPEVEGALVNAYFRVDKLAKAYRILQRKLEKDPNDSEGLVLLSLYFARKGNDEERNRVMNEIIENPKVAYEAKAYILAYHLDNIPEDTLWLERSFNTVSRQYPEEYDVHEQYVSWMIDRNRAEDAIAQIRILLDMNPQNREMWNLYLGLLAQRRDEACEAALLEALENFPDDSFFLLLRAYSYHEKALYNEALDYYQRTINAANPEQVGLISDAYSQMGNLYYTEINDKDRCFTCYDMALQTNPQNAEVLNNYAYFLALEATDLDRAEAMSRESLRINPTSDTYLDTYAWILFQLGRYDMARIYIQRALLNSSDPGFELEEHYGDILWFCGDKNGAREHWQKAVALCPEPSETLVWKADHGYNKP